MAFLSVRGPPARGGRLLESGKTEPNIATFEALGAALNVAGAWLAFGEPHDGNPLAAAGGKEKDRLFAWTVHQTATLITVEGLDGDLSFLVEYARKFIAAAHGASNDLEAKEIIRAAIEAERAEIRKGIDQIQTNRIYVEAGGDVHDKTPSIRSGAAVAHSPAGASVGRKG